MTLSQEFPGLKSTRTCRSRGKRALWSPQKVFVLAVPFEVKVMTVIDTPLADPAVNCTMVTNPLVDCVLMAPPTKM